MADRAPAEGPRALLLLDTTPTTVRRDGSFAGAIDAAVDLDALVANLGAALDAARAAGDRVVWVVPGAELIRRLGGREPTELDGVPDERVGSPREAEPVVEKAEIGAFVGTELDGWLRGEGVRAIVLAGVATQYVVSYTAREGVERGYRVFVLSDCCADLTPAAHADALDSLPAECDRVTRDDVWA